MHFQELTADEAGPGLAQDLTAQDLTAQDLTPQDLAAAAKPSKQDRCGQQPNPPPSPIWK